jgi:hypothetical protein
MWTPGTGLVRFADLSGVIALQGVFSELRPSKSDGIRLSSRYRFEPDVHDVLQVRVNLLNEAPSYKTSIAVVSALSVLGGIS